MNTVDYTKTIDCGLCHEPVRKGDRPRIQGRSGKTGKIFYWPAYLHKACMDSRGKISILDAHKNSYTYVARAVAKYAKLAQSDKDKLVAANKQLDLGI
tara:strand:+ start:3372 stop:3665 length:294 start_codon:yes stop_codon:yes gene_type:complete